MIMVKIVTIIMVILHISILYWIYVSSVLYDVCCVFISLLSIILYNRWAMYLPYIVTQ